MSFDEQEILDRFHRALVKELRAKNPEAVTSPFTVAEIYQDLVPYRTHRDTIGVEMNADYEHALLRLLAGEGDFLSIESTTARQEIRDELDSPNPTTGLYRDFAAADVRLNPLKLEVEELEDATGTEGDGETAGEEGGESGVSLVLQGPPGEEAGVGGALEPEGGSLTREWGAEEGVGEGLDREDREETDQSYEPLDIEPVGADLGPVEEGMTQELASEGVPPEVSDLVTAPETGSAEEGEGEVEGLPPFENCPWCREKLPQRARVRFCPFCGSNVRLVPCPACGEELELNWRFCIACGTEV